MTKTTTQDRIRIVTPEFRVSFPRVFEAKAVNVGDKAKFSIQMLFRVKADPKKPHEVVVDITPLKNAVKAVLVQQFGPDQSKWPAFKKPDGSPAVRLPFRDGKEKGEVDGYGYGDGIVFCSATSINKPEVVDQQKNPILVPSDFYGGCFARASLNLYWYEVKGNKGVALGLQNIQKLRDGEPFSGRSRASDDFDAIPLPASSEDNGGDSTGDPLGL